MRADKYLSEKYGSRSKARRAIESGLVTVNGRAITPSTEIKPADTVEITEPQIKFVSMGGYKLHKAICDFGFCAEGKIFADIGASNGGFTDCLLQSGAKKVYCIDVGESQLDNSLRDKNVVVIDNFNARDLTGGLFEEQLDGVVIDVSFISLTYILPAVSRILSDGKSVLALIKPQFECESRKVGKNGIVTDARTRRKIIEKIYNFAVGVNLAPRKLTCAPIVAGKNIEYVILLEKNGVPAPLSELYVE